MNTTSDSISDALLAAPYQLNIWFGSFLWVAGNLGCMGNMMVFCSRSFRNRAYSIYLLSEAMSDFLYFNFVLLTRVLQKGFQIPLTTRYDVICKFRQFVSIWGNQLSFTLFSLATIDRLLSAQRSNTYRQWSNRRLLAYKMSVICALFWLLLTGHRLVLYSTQNGKCLSLSGFYSYYDNYFEVVLGAVCPPLVMSVLAYLLIRSVRDVIQRRIAPGNNLPQTKLAHRSVLQQMDAQLTLMLILQSAIAIITYFPYAIELSYTNASQNWFKSPLRNAQEKVFIELIHLLSYTFFASSFYVSIISNGCFRRHIKKLFRRHEHTALTGHMNTIFPANATVIIQPK